MQRFLTLFAISKSVPFKSKVDEHCFRPARMGRALLISMVAAGLACGPALPPPPAYPTAEDGLDAPEIETPPGLSKDSPPPQTILPGDVVRLRIMSAESYEPVELWVDDLGRIHVPFGGDVEVLGLGLTDAESRIEQVVRQYDRYARVSLAMHSFSGHRVTVTGAVDKPGVYEARPGLRIADIVASAGGTRVLIAGAEATEAADMEGARIVRDGKTLPVSVKHALFGESQHNVFVRPGDIIYVPWMASRQIPVLGDVRSARNVPFHEGLRLTEALAAAGGPSRTADTADIRIVRGPLSRAKVYRANLDDVMKGDTTDVVLAPGDVIFVTEHWFATTTDVINRLTPILATAAVFSTLSR